MTGHDPYAPATPMSGAIADLPATGNDVDADALPVISVPRDETVVVDPDMVGVVLVPRHLFADDVEQGDVVVLHDAGAETDEFDEHARVVSVTDAIVRVQPFDPEADGTEPKDDDAAGEHDHDDAGTDETTGSEAEAMTGDGAPKDDHELTEEGAPTGPGPSGVEVEGDLVASPVDGPTAPQGVGDGSPAPTATEPAAGDPGQPGPVETGSYDDADVPENATAVVAWLDTAEDDADQRARAEAAQRVENGRAEKDRRVTVERAVADVLDA